jgi:deoxyadenosine/deoxycytidine kinase
MIIGLAGPSAVGKTTLAHSLASEWGGVVIPEVLAQHTPRIADPSRAEEFLENQLWFFERSAESVLAVRRQSGGCFAFVDMGVLEVLVHTRYFPQVIGKGWAIFERFRDRVEAMSAMADCLPDHILYLSASIEMLRARRAGDQSRRRGAHESNLLLLPYEEDLYRKLAECYAGYVGFVDAEPDPAIVFEQAKNRMRSWRRETVQAPTLGQVFDCLGDVAAWGDRE